MSCEPTPQIGGQIRPGLVGELPDYATEIKVSGGEKGDMRFGPQAESIENMTCTGTERQLRGAKNSLKLSDMAVHHGRPDVTAILQDELGSCADDACVCGKSLT